MNATKLIRYPKLVSAHLNVGRIAGLVLSILFAATAAFAQFTAGIQGNVRDAAGANIPNAQMTLVNTATKVQQAGASDASGLYRFTNLGPGISALVLSERVPIRPGTIHSDSWRDAGHFSDSDHRKRYHQR